MDVIEPPAPIAEDVEGAAVAFEVRIPPSGEVSILTGRQRFSLHQAMAGRTVTVWADLRTVHVLLDGEVVRTIASRLRPEDLRRLSMRVPARPDRHQPSRRCGGATALRSYPKAELSRSSGP